jgi:hypothetical protein
MITDEQKKEIYRSFHFSDKPSSDLIKILTAQYGITVQEAWGIIRAIYATISTKKAF